MGNEDLGPSLIKNCEEVSQVMNSLSHPVRLRILCSLLAQERGVNELADICGISQSAMSQFLKRMKTEGILASRRSQHFVYYSIANKKLFKLLRAVKNIYC